MPPAWNSGDAYELAELGEVATVDRLLQDLAVVERLDALIDKCLKRLLFLRGPQEFANGLVFGSAIAHGRAATHLRPTRAA
jgi:hypothetical protein